MSRSISHFVCAMALVVTGAAHAGGPLQLGGASGNTPVTYPDGGSGIRLHLDRGSLGSRGNASADALVRRAMALWNGVGTASVNVAQGGDLPVDVTSSNVGNYLNRFSDGLNPVIYDTDGSIIDALYGVGARKSILGTAGSAYMRSSATYVEGQAIINGYLSLSDSRFVVVLAHELGHFIGLDHTQLDDSQGLAGSDYPLMYPTAYRNQESLHNDDVSAVTALYPNGTVSTSFGEIKGTFVQSGGAILGANVWAENIDTGEVFSSVSDHLKQDTGYFSMLVPPGRYAVHVESIASRFTGGSSVGPYAETSSDASFQAPHPIAPATYTGAGGVAQVLDMSAGCVAELAVNLDGSGNLVNSDCDSGAGAEIVVDNRDANTSRTGTWRVSSASNAWEADSVYNDAGSTFRWKPNVPANGSYEVFAWWTYHTNRSSNVPYRVRHSGGTDTVIVNQRDRGTAAQWVSLGVHDFAAGTTGYVEVSSENGQASADAIKLVQQGTSTPVEEPTPAPASEVIVDNQSSDTSSTGTWRNSSGADPWASNSVYNDGGNRFRWTPPLTASGSYAVYAWWTYHSNRSSNVPYRIRHSGGTDTVFKNQRDSGLAGRWVLLGTYDLDAGTAYVEISSENGQASADAVRLVPVP